MSRLQKFVRTCLSALMCVALLLPSVGGLLPVAADAAATITFNNPVTANGGIALLPDQGDCQTTLTTMGGQGVLVLDQYGYFSVTNADILGATALTVTITFYDNGTTPINLQYGSTSGAYQNRSIDRYNSGEFVTTTVPLTDADFDSQTQNYGGKFRISGGVLRSISITVGVTDDTTQAPPTFAAQTNLNNMLNKGIAGYQAWFRASNNDSEWVHWGGNGSANPKADALSFEIYPHVDDYLDNGATLYQSGLGDLGNGDKALLFNSTDPAIVDTHFSWMQQYDLDGVAVQRFYSATSVAKTTARNTLQLIQEKAEKYNRIFYVMYDFSGCGTRDAASFIRDIQLDFIYNVEDKGVASSANYAHANGKPVVCMWGISGEPNSGYVYGSTATALIQWFQSRGYYVIVGTPDNGYTDRTGTNLTPFTIADMVSPWTVGRYDQNGAANWLNYQVPKDLAFCNQYGLDYQPVVFAGFGWTNMGNNGPINAFPHNAGQFLWTQAHLLKSKGVSNIYFAMFDEYDEGTAFMKGAADYFEIPTDQYFLTYAADGWWLSNDFYLRAAGAVIDMMQGITPLRSTIDIPHSQGPVYWRNSFETRSTTYYLDGVQHTGVGQLDVCLNNPAVLSTSAVTLTTNAIVGNSAKSGQSAFRLSGTASGTGTAYYKIADTVINANAPLQLTYWLYAANGNGREVFVDLLFSDGSKLSDVNSAVTATHGTVGSWAEVTVNLGTAATGKTITGVIVGYAGGSGSFDAYVDDICIQNAASGEYPTTVTMTEVTADTAFVDYANGQYSNISTFVFGDDASSGSYVSLDGVTMAKFSGYLYLNVNESYIGANDNDVLVRITYLDTTAGNPIKLQYNSNDPDAYPSQDYTDLLVTGTASGTWRTVEIPLSNASFRNAQNGGCDLRISCNNGSYLYVTRVEIVNTGADAFITFDATSNTGSGLSLVESGVGDCAYTATTYNGTPVRRIDDYLYVTLANTAVRAAARVEVEVEYYDLGTTRLNLQYNATTEAYKNVGVNAGNTGGLVSHTFVLNDAAFTGAQNYGADFRLSGAGLYIRSIKVRILDSASVLFGSTNVESGLTVVASGTGDCVYSSVTVDGMALCQIDQYLYCTINNAAVKNASSVTVTVTYYDNSNGNVTLQYSADSETYKSVSVAKGNTGALNTAVFTITDANFAGGQNYGADFRLTGGTYIKSIIITPNV